jgi:hypothetical protein
LAKILGTLRKAKYAVVALPFLALIEAAISNAEEVPWAQITAAPDPNARYVDRRDYSYDTANPHLYGYTSVGMDGTQTQCDYTKVFYNQEILLM